MITINTSNLRGEPIPLYKLYPGQNQPQRAFVSLDEEGTVRAGINYEIGGAVPMDVWHGRTLRWSVSPYANGDSLADLLESDRVKELFERVYAGHEVVWNGNNMVGRLDEDAEDASEELERILEPGSGEYDLAQICEAYDFISEWFRLEELVDAGSVEALAEKELASNDSELVIVGDMEEAVATRAAELIELRLERGKVDDIVLRAAEILADYDKYEYSSLLKACREAIEE